MRPHEHAAQLPQSGRRLRPDRPAEGGRAARRRGHRDAPAGAWLHRGRRPRAANRPTWSTWARSTWPASSNAWARRRWWPTRWRSSPAAATTTRIAQDTIAMAINDLITVGATPLVVQAYWAAGGSRLVRRRRRARRPWSTAGSAPATPAGGLGRRRDAGAGRHRRGRAHRPGGLVHRPGQPEAAADAGRQAGPRRRHRAARLQRHPRQRPEPGAQAGRTAAAGLPDRRCSRA